MDFKIVHLRPFLYTINKSRDSCHSLMSQLDFARRMEALGEAVMKLDGEYPNTPTFFCFH